MSTRSSNFGADKSVTVPARASRIRAKRDMIDELVICRVVIARLGQWRQFGPVVGRREYWWEGGNGDAGGGGRGGRYVQMSTIY